MTNDFFQKFQKNAARGPAHLLVTGCGRSGTTALTSLLNSHPRIGILAEFGWARILETTDVFFKAHEEAIGRLKRPLKQLTLREYIDPLDTMDDDELVDAHLALPLAEITEEIMDEVAVRLPELTMPCPALHFDRVVTGFFSAVFPDKVLSVIGDKTPDLLKWEDHFANLRTRLPRLKVLYIFRDPMEVLASSLKRRDDTLAGEDQWHVTSIEHAYGDWRNDALMALEIAKEHPDAIHFVYYDDLLDDTAFAKVSAGIASFLGVQNSFVNNFSARPQRPFSDPEEQALVEYAFPKIAAAHDLPRQELLATMAVRQLPLKTDRVVEMALLDSGAIDLPGFGDREETGRWTIEPTATVGWRVYGAPCFGVRLEISPRRIGSEKPTELTIDFCGIKTTRLLPQSQDWSKIYDIELRFDQGIPVGEAAHLRLEIGNSKTADEEPVADERRLGVRLIRFTPLG
ncbi:hypothetical protein ASD79_00895 [Caulobacter sp. Root655]|uniref:sulfotransferase n=1 Tax=Caulobacter sp. Root655 TaxID=1736578 RepID=UPI0006F5E0E7|nr:sulfotransferase [Caulobacter sp. Root655]KRA65872.1 hypothetical protein ASD79_00895 [Caulobacter sp. Root655]